MKKTSIVSLLALSASLMSSNLNAQTTAGLNLWLKPEGLTNTVNASSVSFWTDSAAGYHATNTTGTQRPTLLTSGLNGYPVVRFTGNGIVSASLNHLQSPLPYNASTNPFTAVIVYRSDFVGSRQQLIHQVGGYAMLYVLTNVSGTNLQSNASGQVVNGSANNTSWKVVTLVEDATTIKMYQNGALVGSSPLGVIPPVATSGGGFVFGARQDKSRFGFNGEIAEIMIYTNALSEVQRATTEIYLSTKYNLPTSVTLLTDNFNTVSDPGDQNDDLVTRQSGLSATQSYYSGGGPVNIAGGKLNLNNASPIPGYQYFYAAPNWNIIAYEGGASVQISFDIVDLNGAYTGNPNDSWASFSLSQYADGGGGPVTDWGFLIRTNGTGAIIHMGSGGSWPAFSGFSVTGTNNYNVQLTLVGGIAQLVINGVACGNTPILCPLGSNVRRMFFGVGQANNGAISAGFDNLVVTRTSVPGPSTPATLRFSDGFNSADSSDINTDVSRQTGPAATAVWNTNLNNTTVSIGANALALTNTPGGGSAIALISSSLDFRQWEHLNSFRISYTVSGGNDATPNDSWTGIRFRDNAPGKFVADADGGGTGMNFNTGDGRWFLWQSILGPTNTGSMLSFGTVPLSSIYEFVYEVRNNVLQVKINGLQLPLGCAGAGHNITPAQLANYITLQCLAQAPATTGYAVFDNFKFEALDPGFTIPAPTIINAAHVGTGFRFSASASNNIFYAVDSKADLSAPTWNYLGGFVGNGGVFNYTNSPATNGAGFYRLRIP